ncbi:MAG: hypothetical protein Q4F70_00640, partial [Clostridia bacterium]|nr:hypothetical protein [Clostridia bacterium]
ATAPAADDAAALPEFTEPQQAIEFKDFSFTVNGQEITNADLKDCTIYKVKLDGYLYSDKDGEKVLATDKETGEPLSVSYTGYKLADVLKAAGVDAKASVKVITSDGYDKFGNLAGEDGEIVKATYDLTVNPDYYLVAIEKNKEQAADGTIYFAPVMEDMNKQYASMVVGFEAE